MSIIKYGISMNYLPHWGYKEALREVIQNFKDYGEFQTIENDKHITMSNMYSPDSLEFLKIGFSNKGNNSNAIGKHGEGIKMAMMVFHRLGIKCEINSASLHKTITPIMYEDEMLGTCFGVDVSSSNKADISYLIHQDFAFRLQKSVLHEDIDIINDSDIVFNSYQGRIVNKESGKIYVGGIYVTKIDNLTHAYDLNPSCVSLGRDRDFPSTFDIEWHCSKINQEYLKLKESSVDFKEVDFEKRDFSYMDYLPDSIVKNISPVIDEETEEISYSCSNKVVPYKLYDALQTHPIMKEKIKQVKFMIGIKEQPYDLITKFYNTFENELSYEAKLQLEHIKTMSVKWGIKE